MNPDPHYCYNCSNTGQEWLPGACSPTPCRYCDKPTGKACIWLGVILFVAVIVTWIVLLLNL